MFNTESQEYTIGSAMYTMATHRKTCQVHYGNCNCAVTKVDGNKEKKFYCGATSLVAAVVTLLKIKEDEYSLKSDPFKITLPNESTIISVCRTDLHLLRGLQIDRLLISGPLSVDDETFIQALIHGKHVELVYL